MNEKEILFFKTLLTERLEEIEEKNKNTLVYLKENEENNADVIEHASIKTSQEFMMRLSNRENVLIKKIKSALTRIEEGSFGICEVCDEEIFIERLKARPVATKCIKCKNKEELQEKSGQRKYLA